MKRPPQLTGYTPPLLGGGDATPNVDVNALAVAAFDNKAVQTTVLATRTQPVYNRAIGIHPAANDACRSGEEESRAAHRDLTLPD